MNEQSETVLKKPAKASAFAVAANLLSRGLSAMSAPLFTRLLSPGEYGVFALYLSWFNILSALAAPGLSGSVLYRGMQKYRDSKGKFLRVAVGFYLILPLIIVLPTLFFRRGAEGLTGLSYPLILLVFAQILLGAPASVLMADARYGYRYRRNTLLNLAVSVLSIGAGIGAILLFRLGGTGRILGNVIGAGVLSVPTLLILLRENRDKTKKNGGKASEILVFLTAFILPLLPHYFAVALLGRLDHVLIGRMLGKEVLGGYAVASALGLAPMMLTMGLTAAYQPWLMRKLRAKGEEKIAETNGLLMRCVAPILLLFLAFVPEIFPLIAPEKYAGSQAAIYPLALSVLPRLLSAILTAGILFHEKTGILSLPSLAVAALSIGADILLLPRYGALAAAYVVLIGQVALAVGYAIVFKKLHGSALFRPIGYSVGFAAVCGYALLLYAVRDEFALRCVLTLPCVATLLTAAPGIKRTLVERKAKSA